MPMKAVRTGLIMAGLPSGWNEERGAGSAVAPRAGALLAALDLGLEDVAGDRIDVHLHALSLRVGGLTS